MNIAAVAAVAVAAIVAVAIERTTYKSKKGTAVPFFVPRLSGDGDGVSKAQLMNIRIRKIRQEDIGFIYEMICDLEHQRLNRREFNAVFRANLQNPDVHYLIAFNNDTPVGFGSLHIQRLLHHTGAVGEVQELYTSPDVRGLGIGKQLLAALRRIAVKKNCKNLEVTSNRRREAAHRFYVREGMQQSHFKFVEALRGDVDE